MEHSHCLIGLSDSYSLGCGSLLRYIGNDGVFITNQDHGQWFGLGEPYNAESEIENRIKGKIIKSVAMRAETGDLELRVDDASIEVICSSLGYENWQLDGPNGFIMARHGGKVT